MPSYLVAAVLAGWNQSSLALLLRCCKPGRRIRQSLYATLLMVFVGWGGAAPAALIERDWKTTGDGLLTYDSRTGLEWLDITQTQLKNFPPGSLSEDSFQAVVAQTLPGGQFAGFTVATAAQALELAFSAGVDPEILTFQVNEAGAGLLLSLLGSTQIRSDAVILKGSLSDVVLVSRSFLARQQFTVFRTTDAGSVRRDAYAWVSHGYRIVSQTFPNPDVPGEGVMLVRLAVPEPYSLFLALLGVTTSLLPQRRKHARMAGQSLP